MFAGKPIIGIVGGIGSGKSFVADLFGEFGCRVIHSDELAKDAYNDVTVRQALSEWWDGSVFTSDGLIDRSAVASKVFSDSHARRRLEQLLHPIISRRRQEIMAADANNSRICAFIWDSPLLIEAGLHTDCDAIVFVHAPLELRLARVGQRRSWDKQELPRRENLQQPLDNKRKISEYVIDNTADADYARGQVKDVISRIRC
jgi:dephospho-CoA kinase